MALRAAPAFDTLERLSRSADADILAFEQVPVERARGRGARSNRSSRFDSLQRHGVDDGWSQEDPQGDFETREHVERACSIISRNRSPDLPFDQSINPYRGCAHGCAYCYARPTHNYLGHSAGLDFERDIHIKPNAAELLREELGRPRYRARVIAIGTNTDGYQPLERKYRIMRDLLKVFLETQHPVAIITKSALVTRDLDLLGELAQRNLVSVTLSLTSMDHRLSRWMEPRASSPARRLEAIDRLREAGVPVHVLAAPMIPAINDMELERLLENAAAQGARSAGMLMLRLPGEVSDIFREWLLHHYPDKLSHVLSLVRSVRGGKTNDARFHSRFTGQGPYAAMLQQRFKLVADRLGLSRRPPTLCHDLFVAPTRENRQLSLF